MTSTTVSAQILSKIIQQGQQILYQKHLIQSKLASHIKDKAVDENDEMMMQIGAKRQKIKQNHYYEMKPDSKPQNIRLDQYSFHANKIAKEKKKHIIKSSSQKNNNKKKYFFSTSKIKTSAFNTFNGQSYSKQNTLVQLEEPKTERVIIKRIKDKEEMIQNEIREEKRRKDNQKNQEKLMQSQKNRIRKERMIKISKNLNDHLGGDSNNKFTYGNEGQIILFKHQNHFKRNYPPQTNFNVCDENQQQMQIIFNHKETKAFSNNKSNRYEHQKIRSAKGQAFASAVLKTVNLSRISMNNTMMEVDPEQFMKRNDLFNNNHTRQTTNIPFFDPKEGTVYTEIATKQVISHKDNSSLETKSHQKTESVHGHNFFKRKGGFEKYDTSTNHIAKSVRVMPGQHFQSEANQNEHTNEVTIRPIRTADISGRRFYRQQRPKTSARGQITINKDLMGSLLE